MNSFKPAVGILLFAGIMSIWIFKVYNNTKANEDVLEQKINSIDSKINELKSELSFLAIEEVNKTTTNK